MRRSDLELRRDSTEEKSTGLFSLKIFVRQVAWHGSIAPEIRYRDANPTAVHDSFIA
jgi:hypothetical protein